MDSTNIKQLSLSELEELKKEQLDIYQQAELNKDKFITYLNEYGELITGVNVENEVIEEPLLVNNVQDNKEDEIKEVKELSFFQRINKFLNS